MCGAADCMAALGHFEDAIKQYSKVLKADPSYVPAYGGRSDAWLSWGHTGDSARQEAAQEQAVADLRALLAVEPDHADALHGLGTLHVAQQRLADAADAFSRVLAADPSHVRALGALASLRHEAGAHGEAEEMTGRALALLQEQQGEEGAAPARDSPAAMQRAGLLCQRAAIRFAAGRFEGCLEDAEGAAGLVSQHFGLAQMLLGQSAYELGRHERAVAALSAVIEAAGEHETALDGSCPLEVPQLAQVYFTRARAHFGKCYPQYQMYDEEDENDEDHENDENDENHDENQNDSTELIPSSPQDAADLEPIVRETYTLIRGVVMANHKSNAAIAFAGVMDAMIQDCSKALQLDDSAPVVEDIFHLLSCAQDALKNHSIKFK